MIKRSLVIFVLLFSLSACSVQDNSSPESATPEGSTSNVHTKLCGDGVCGAIEQETGGCPEDCESTEQSLDIDSTSESSSSEQWWPDSNGAWSGNLILAYSDDGLTFTEGERLIQYGGVPNLLYTSKGQLIATYQYFSREDESLYDVIAYSVSEDEGETWSDPQKINFEELPEGRTTATSTTKPMDPTLVETEDGGLRLYFTYHGLKDEYARLASVYSEDGDISSSFVYDNGETPDIHKGILDPAVVYFNGLWHHYTWDMDSSDNYHSTSEDGINFELQENIEGLDMDFLGQVIVVDDGLRFYGTGNGITTAISEEGYTWEIEKEDALKGADPGVAQLEDGSYLMLYTSANFND